MENLNDPKKQNDEIIPQNTDEIEVLNDNEELDLESLEEVAGGRWGCDGRTCEKNDTTIEVNR